MQKLKDGSLICIWGKVLSKAEAEEMKAKLEAEGAEVNLK